ncbi:hypothetical protein BN159_1468 [Streptomyces davaonensis JCM 4913]|uniref:Uncharacterized protein n=1 Tax=Streptomyces davaonensis (strain DSM 101723 / JCM 4913 / KCC S-0913 / 768) TaxID=1214101 RepID=K4QY63_STRDJ|nr:hypothetical protein [Streptomyces davaonensis]CCK25847.1 hypothetical protein BN159_1468 [Streptomyces davaonensis JCM 4913]
MTLSPAGNPDGVRIFAKYARLWAVLVMLGATVVGVVLTLWGLLFDLDEEWSTALAAIGESVIASVFIYVMVSLFLDPVRQRLQAQELAGYAIDVAHSQFRERFEASLPSGVFESADVPKLAFREAFQVLLESSTRYDSKGGAAEFATFRLSQGAEKRAFRRLDQIRLCIIDPRAEECLRAHVVMRLRERRAVATQQRVDDDIATLQGRVFVSLTALHDLRVALPTTVYLHRDLPFFRCEMFDSGMFLTYYLDGTEYPENLQFSSKTRPYRAYHASLDMTRRFASKVIPFGTGVPHAIETDQQFGDLLTELGCTLPLDELRTLRDRRFEEFRSQLRAAGIDERDIF